MVSYCLFLTKYPAPLRSELKIVSRMPGVTRYNTRIPIRTEAIMDVKTSTHGYLLVTISTSDRPVAAKNNIIGVSNQLLIRID